MTARANLHLFMAFSAVSSDLVPNVALSKENDASIPANGKLERARQDLAVVVDTLHAKWGSSTELTKAFDEKSVAVEFLSHEHMRFFGRSSLRRWNDTRRYVGGLRRECDDPESSIA